MRDEQLFINLLHKLGNYSDACILDVILHNVDANLSWLTSRRVIAEKMRGHLSDGTVYKSLQRLSDKLDLLSLSLRANAKTEIKVNESKLIEFIKQDPVNPALPGLRIREHPFLKSLNSDSKMEQDSAV